MLETAVVTIDSFDDEIISLERITTLKVYNKSNVRVDINGIVVYPNQKEVIIPADSTFSNVNVDIKFLPFKISSGLPPKKQLLLTYKKLI